MSKGIIMKAARVIINELPAPGLWDAVAKEMSMEDKGLAVVELELAARKAAMLAAYLEERYGNGCGDQGHEAAVKSANRAGAAVWQKAFGYMAFRPYKIGKEIDA